MTDPQLTKETPSRLENVSAQLSPAKVSTTKLPLEADADGVTAGKCALPRRLTADEQMALFEEALKESDWGHQPC